MNGPIYLTYLSDDDLPAAVCCLGQQQRRRSRQTENFCSWLLDLDWTTLAQASDDESKTVLSVS